MAVVDAFDLLDVMKAALDLRVIDGQDDVPIAAVVGIES
jgi:hypothetical protein